MRSRALLGLMLSTLLVGLAPAASAGGADACVTDLPLDGRQAVESARFRVVFQTRPERIEVGEHFSVELTVCPRGGAPRPDNVRVDAEMPEHRHGMNYRPTVIAEDPGRYRAEGLLFHMPGHWLLVFEVRAGGQTDRLTRSVELE